MKNDFGLVKMSWVYVIGFINDEDVHFSASILVSKITRKYRLDKVSA